LVHGLWSNPEDWQWVRRILEGRDVAVITPDLPSHRSSSAGLAEDAEDVRQAIRSCQPPVVLVGWSYGGNVISMAAAEETSVKHLIYVADIPRRVDRYEGQDLAWAEQDPHVIVNRETFVLDNDWWMNEEAGTTFSREVADHLRRHPRRPAARAATRPQTSAAWQTTKTTVLIGREDQLLLAAQLDWARDNLEDVRLMDTDHFILFRHPDVISHAVLEALDAT